MKYVFVFLACSTLFGCSGEDVDRAAVSGRITVAVLPDQSKDALLARHGSLLDYLADTTSLDFELLIPLDYADLVDQFDAGHIDLAWFGGLTFIRAHEKSQAVPLAFRDVDSRFTSCYLVRGSDTRSTIQEFAGEEFSFGPPLSTSGHLMPRYFLERDGLYPEQFFAATRHSSAHDQTARWVRDGTVGLGVASCIIVQSMLEHGSLSSDDIRIIETTPPYSNYVWAVKQTMAENTKTKLLDAFLALDASDPDNRAILRAQRANAYLPASPDNFVLVRRAAKLSGVFSGDNES